MANCSRLAILSCRLSLYATPDKTTSESKVICIFTYSGGTGNPDTVFKTNKMTHNLSHLSDVCFYCKRSYALHKSVWRRKYAALRKTKDHVLPKSKGGLNDVGNYVSCCEDCNHLKSNMKPNEFAKWLKKELRQRTNNHPMFPMFKYMMFNAWKLHNKKQKLFTNEKHRF